MLLPLCVCVSLCVCLCVCLQFVSRSLDDLNSEEWLMALGSAMGEKDLVVERYTHYPEEKVRGGGVTCTSYVPSASAFHDLLLTRNAIIRGATTVLLKLHTCMYMYRALCLEYRVSWVRVPPEAAHFF